MKTIIELTKEQLEKCLDTLRTVQNCNETIRQYDCCNPSTYAELEQYIGAVDKRNRYEGIFKKQVNAFAKFVGIEKQAKDYYQAQNLLWRIEDFTNFIQQKREQALNSWMF